jgi:hypothetical protein
MSLFAFPAFAISGNGGGTKRNQAHLFPCRGELRDPGMESEGGGTEGSGEFTNMRGFVVTCGGYRARGQLMNSCPPPPALDAAIMRSASASEAANGFSTNMCAPEGATSSTKSACRPFKGQRMTRSGFDASRHWRRRGNTVRQDAKVRNGGLDGFIVPGRVVADSDDLGFRAFVGLPEQVSHVHVLKRNPGDFHWWCIFVVGVRFRENDARLGLVVVFILGLLLS